ncbi:differentially expressed in FDCP 8 homolog A isoform X2 [Neocloeon triangulifer]|uniref:differentially expressed in FDCP 8 homolog A isoform X2 n=1 Tax=Neocloeon triangulifer TaxID=2078957 RepID=UPI00286F955C|nr:differentially expressed in FDCP 8 homolog A isoform X2 [Neocloeon triangulifer]
MADRKSTPRKESVASAVSPSRTIYSTPSTSTSGFNSGNDSSPPWDQGWQLFIPASIQDGPSRFGFIENALAEGNEQRLQEVEERCKTLVSESPDGSDERRWLVRQLVEVRLKLQEKKDDDISSKATVRLVLGHHMQLQENNLHNTKLQCDRCCAAIWAMIHSWFRCRDCDFVCHTRCLSQVTRACVHVAVSERPEYELRICPEVGLASAQRFKCTECNTSVIFTDHSWSEPRICDYSGCYFCPTCHWNTTAIIPARVVHNWDFEPRKVSRAAQQLLKLMAEKPVLVLKDLNPRLFGLVEELSVIQGLREDLLQMKRYLSTCDSAIAQHIMWQVGSKQHLIENAHSYSLQDLIDIYSGTMLPYINQIHESFSKHIKEDCKVCFGRGFVCELCNSKKVQVLFPFDPAAYSCPSCLFVFHNSCWHKRKNSECPRCLRIKERQRKLSTNCDDEEEP